MTNNSTPAGWYQDPTGQGDARYWNGTAWTQSVNRAGTTSNVAIDPTLAQQPPVAGTQVQAPAPAAAPQTVVQQSSSGSPLGTIIGVIAVVLLIIVVLAFIGNNDSSDDTPTPGSDTPPAEAPAESAPAAPADTSG
jgi:hypothetical protein